MPGLPGVEGFLGIGAFGGGVLWAEWDVDWMSENCWCIGSGASGARVGFSY